MGPYIRMRHRYFRSEDTEVIAAVVAHPNEIRRRASEINEFLVVRNFDEGRRPVCVVVARVDSGSRWWVATAYRSDLPSTVGDVLWTDDAHSI